MSELKPCPFCGKTDARIKHSSRWGWFVSCQCAAVGPSSKDRKSAILSWNTRPEPIQGRLDL